MAASPFAISDQLIDDTVTTALEGGINYWAASAIPDHWPAGTSKMFPGEDPYASEVLTMGADLLITTDHEAGGEVFRLTKSKLKKGIRAYCALRKITPAAIDDDPLDASGADVVVQLALFGEVIYG